MVNNLQGLVGVTLSAGVPALQDGSHVNRATFFIGFLYVIALGRQRACSPIICRACSLLCSSLGSTWA